MIRPALLMMLLTVSGTAAAGMADLAHRSKVEGIDLITYHSNVKDVVIVLGVVLLGCGGPIYLLYSCFNAMHQPYHTAPSHQSTPSGSQATPVRPTGR